MPCQVSDVNAVRIEIARAKLKNRLSALEHRIVNTVDRATHSVQKVTDSVKSTVTHATDGVQRIRQFASKDIFNAIDIRKPVRKAPWSSLGVAVVVGLLSASLTKRRASAESNADSVPSPGIKGVLKRELITIGASVIADVAGMVREHLHHLAERQGSEHEEGANVEADVCCAASH